MVCGEGRPARRGPFVKPGNHAGVPVHSPNHEKPVPVIKTIASQKQGIDELLPATGKP